MPAPPRPVGSVHARADEGVSARARVKGEGGRDGPAMWPVGGGWTTVVCEWASVS